MKATPNIRGSETRDRILDRAITEFGKFGLKKTTVDALASAADLSKPALYAHFSGKEEIYVESIERYLKQTLASAKEQLELDGTSVADRLTKALECWFGSHKDTFDPAVADIFTTGNRLTADVSHRYALEFKRAIADSITRSMASRGPPAKARNIAEVLFVCGLSWKEYGVSRSEFSQRLRTCVRVCLGADGVRG